MSTLHIHTKFIHDLHLLDIRQSCQLSRILRETHAFRHNLTLTRIITSISRAEQAVYITHIIYTHHGVYAGRNQDGVIIAAS